MPFPFLMHFFSGRYEKIKMDDQVKNMIKIIFFAFLINKIYLVMHSTEHEYKNIDLLFNIVASSSTGGFATRLAYDFAPIAFLTSIVLSFIGGCTGSTAGGLKIMRIIIIWRKVKMHFKSILMPNTIVNINISGKNVKPEYVDSVFTFFFFIF